MTDEAPNRGLSEKPDRKRPTAFHASPDGDLAELLYCPDQRSTAFAVWDGNAWSRQADLTLGNGERLVPYSPNNNLISNRVVVLPSIPAEYASEAELLEAIRGFIHRYVDIPQVFEKIASNYVLLSWVHDAFNELPYLRLRGDFGTGKTRFLLTVGSLCYKAFFASGASTVSPIFHTLDAFRGTLVIDEADFRFSDEKAEIVKILNNGNVKGMPVLRTLQNGNREFNPRAFHVFGPKIVATRGDYDDRALESRFITIEMGSRPLRADIPINLPPGYQDEARELRNQLLLYRFRNLRTAGPDEALIDPEIEPRLNQIFVPLLSIVDEERLRWDIRSLSRRYQAETILDRELTVEGQLLDVLHDLFVGPSMNGLPLKQIAERFAERHGRDVDRAITPKWIGTMLRRRLRVSPQKMHGVYILPRSEVRRLQPLFERYGIASDEDDDSIQPNRAESAADIEDIGDVHADQG